MREDEQAPSNENIFFFFFKSGWLGLGPGWNAVGGFHQPKSVWLSTSLYNPLGLTLIAELEADVRVTLVRREEEVEVVAGTDEELGHLGPMVNSNQRRRICLSISHFQGVIVDLSFKPTK